jgi:type II restriction enzyme
MDDYSRLTKDLKTLVGTSVPKPSGTLAGHAAGLPFEKLVHERLVTTFAGRALRHFEFLNDVLSRHENDSVAQRLEAFGPVSLQGLLCRGRTQMAQWTPSKLFDEKQNDTAETIISSDLVFDPNSSHLLLLDVKTYNAAKNGQPPNIISAGKLSEALASALEDGQLRFDIVYVGVSWTVEGETLRGNEISVVSLFKMDPKLYVNWAAAEQIQFHPHLAKQEFTGSREQWANEFLEHFVESLDRRIGKQAARLERFRTITRT